MGDILLYPPVQAVSVTYHRLVLQHDVANLAVAVTLSELRQVLPRPIARADHTGKGVFRVLHLSCEQFSSYRHEHVREKPRQKAWVIGVVHTGYH